MISILLLAAVGDITKLRCMHRECYIFGNATITHIHTHTHTPTHTHTHTAGDTIGDACANDYDGDSVLNTADHCPIDHAAASYDIRPATFVNLGSSVVAVNSSLWSAADKGAEIVQRGAAETSAVMAIGQLLLQSSDGGYCLH